jgi:hypothetical protein
MVKTKRTLKRTQQPWAKLSVRRRRDIELLRAGVAGKKITADAAAEQLAKSLDLPASLRIQIRETVKAAFEAGDDVVSKIRPYLRRSTQVTEQHAGKTIAVTSDV